MNSTPPTEADDWENEFSDKFCGTGRFNDFISYKEVIDWIAHHKLLWEDEARKKVVKKIVMELRQRAYDYTKGDMYAQGYYQAVSDIAALEDKK